ncbi:hypothetical protein D3C78_1039730 [compost metagenome]
MQFPYRREGDTWQIDLQLESLHQLVNNMDPSPFPRRDLDPDAEHYIVKAARELPAREPWALALWLPASELTAGASERVSKTLRHYFEWEVETAQQRLREHLRSAWRTTLLGLLFMALCMLIRNLLMPLDHLLTHTAGEGLLVIGWVALWRPLEMFLYDWWPLHREARLMQRLAALQISLRPLGAPCPADSPARSAGRAFASKAQ